MALWWSYLTNAIERFEHFRKGTKYEKRINSKEGWGRKIIVFFIPLYYIPSFQWIVVFLCVPHVMWNLCIVGTRKRKITPLKRKSKYKVFCDLWKSLFPSVGLFYIFFFIHIHPSNSNSGWRWHVNIILISIIFNDAFSNIVILVRKICHKRITSDTHTT